MMIIAAGGGGDRRGQQVRIPWKDNENNEMNIFVNDWLVGDLVFSKQHTHKLCFKTFFFNQLLRLKKEVKMF